MKHLKLSSPIFDFFFESMEECKQSLEKLRKSKEDLKRAKEAYNRTIEEIRRRKLFIQTPEYNIEKKHSKIPQPTPIDDLSYDEELENIGWTKTGSDFYGKIKTEFFSYECCLQHKGRGEYNLLIHDPPETALNGSHGRCFIHVVNNWYSVHFNFSENPVVLITMLEKYINEVIEN